MIAMANSTPLPARPTLTSLPRDIISHVTSYLDAGSLVTLARVSKYCHQFLDDSIWRELNITLSPRFGLRPTIYPFDPATDQPAFVAWLARQGEAAEETLGIALRNKVERMLSSGDEGKWSKVTKIRLDPRPAAVLPTLAILEFASASLQMLRIETTEPADPGPILVPHSAETLDHTLIGSRITFPSSTHLELGTASNCTGGLILLLCQMSPNLISGIFNLLRFRLEGYNGPPWMPFPPFVGPTQIRRLRMMWETISDDEDDEMEAFVSLIRESPSLSQLSVGFGDPQAVTMGDLVSAMRDHPNLEDLHLDWHTGQVRRYLGDDSSGFGNLRRLVIISGEWWKEVFTNKLPALPNLQSLYLDSFCTDPLPSPHPNPHPSPVRRMIPAFSTMLRNCRNLHKIYSVRDLDRQDFTVFERLDAIDAEGTPKAIVSSYRQGDSEVVHARMLTNFTEVFDFAGTVTRPRFSAGAASFEYQTLDGVSRTKVLSRTEYATWQDYTDWDGHLVPLRVLEAMRVADGVGEEEWSKRGVEVGEASWKVFTDWRDGAGNG